MRILTIENIRKRRYFFFRVRLWRSQIYILGIMWNVTFHADPYVFTKGAWLFFERIFRSVILQCIRYIFNAMMCICCSSYSTPQPVENVVDEDEESKLEFKEKTLPESSRSIESSSSSCAITFKKPKFRGNMRQRTSDIWMWFVSYYVVDYGIFCTLSSMWMNLNMYIDWLYILHIFEDFSVSSIVWSL